VTGKKSRGERKRGIRKEQEIARQTHLEDVGKREKQ